MQANLISNMENTSTPSVTKEYYGEPISYDPEFKGAKIERRSTDFKCLILFVVCAVIWLVIAVFALIQGDLSIYSNAINKKEVIEENEEFSKGITSDLKKTWPVMVFGIGFGIAACLIFVVIMRWVATFVTWASIFLSMLLLGIAAVSRIIGYTKHQQSEEGMFYLISGIVFVILFVVLAIFICICYRKIKISIELIKEASEATSTNIFVMFFPMLQSVIEVLVIVFAVCIYLNLSSIGERSYHIEGMKNGESCACSGKTYNNNDTCILESFNRDCAGTLNCKTAVCGLANIKHPVHVQLFICYTFFEFLWFMFFITAIAEMVLAGFFATWYWTFNKDSVPSDSFSQSFHRTFRYHLGTLAFGSLIITIIRIIKILISYAKGSLKDSNNPLARIAFACLECLVQAIEDFMKMINKNAYILTAVHGTDFVTSAKNAFNLIMRNILGVIVLNNVTGFVFFMMQLTVSLGATACFYTAITVIYNETGTGLHVPGVLVLIYFIVIFFITAMFLSVFSMAVDTLFLCFLEDLERNDGSHERPYFMSPKLREILQKED